jgi:uncharacterized protein
LSAGPLLIIGASGRAAAQWATARGYEPTVVDLFADRDTPNAIEHDWLRDPAGLLQLIDALPSMPWMYCGGLENHADLIGAIGRRRPLIGNGQAVLAAIRDPVRLSDGLARLGLSMPAIATSAPSDGTRWLIKPLASGGGRGIRWDTVPPGPGEYCQQYCPGIAISAAFETTRRGAELLGTSRILHGEAWLHAKPFQYCGNLTGDFFHDDFQRIGLRLIMQFGLQSLWGIDCIKSEHGLRFLEINPRFTASMELFARPGRCRGKAIYYAPRDLIVPAIGPWCAAIGQSANDRDYADLPHAGRPIAAGQPVLTLFAASGDALECEGILRARAHALDELFEVQS